MSIIIIIHMDTFILFPIYYKHIMTSYDIVWYTTIYHDTVILWFIMIYYDTLWYYDILLYIIIYYDILGYVMLYWIILYFIFYYIIITMLLGQNLVWTPSAKVKDGRPARPAPRMASASKNSCPTLWQCQQIYSYWKWPFIMDFPIEHGDFQ